MSINWQTGKICDVAVSFRTDSQLGGFESTCGSWLTWSRAATSGQLEARIGFAKSQLLQLALARSKINETDNDMLTKQPTWAQLSRHMNDDDQVLADNLSAFNAQAQQETFNVWCCIAVSFESLNSHT